MIKGIDLLTHPDAEEIIVYEGSDAFAAGEAYGDLLRRMGYIHQNKPYKILNRIIDNSNKDKWIISIIAEPI